MTTEPKDAEIARLRAENEALRTGDWSNLRLVRFENGQFDFSGSPVQYIAEFFAQVMENGEGDHFNNMEIQFGHPKAGAMVLTVQRKQGLTPAEQRKKAEAERDAALAQVAAAITGNKSGTICRDCRGVGMIHCSDPFNCGGMQPYTVEELKSALSRRDAQMRAEGLREAAGIADAKDPDKPANYLHRRENIPAAILAAAEKGGVGMDSAFDDAIASLCGKEMAAARKAGDNERMAGMIQSLTSILGKTIAMTTAGNPAACDMLLTGAENMMREEATGFAPLVALTRRSPRP